MTIRIKCEGKIILTLKNSLFEFLHNEISEILESKEVLISENLQNFLYETDQTVWGTGVVAVDVAQLLHSKKDVLMLADLVQSVIEKNREKFLKYDGALGELSNFHQHLVSYAMDL